MGWVLRIKNFNIMGVSWKIQVLGGGRFGKKTINKKGWLKRGLGQLAKLVEGLAKTVIFSGWFRE